MLKCLPLEAQKIHNTTYQTAARHAAISNRLFLSRISEHNELLHLSCVFHAIRPLSPARPGHLLHDDPAGSVAKRRIKPKRTCNGGFLAQRPVRRSVATLASYLGFGKIVHMRSEQHRRAHSASLDQAICAFKICRLRFFYF
jgi:hypothetical protein